MPAYKTIVLELLKDRPMLHEQLRGGHAASTMEQLAVAFRACHLNRMKEMIPSRPGSDRRSYRAKRWSWRCRNFRTVCRRNRCRATRRCRSIRRWRSCNDTCRPGNRVAGRPVPADRPPPVADRLRRSPFASRRFVAASCFLSGCRPAPGR